MGFSKNVKQEIISKDFNSNCCRLAFVAGVFDSCAKFEDNKFVVSGDQKDQIEYIGNNIEKVCGKNIGIKVVGDYGINKSTYYFLEMNVEEFSSLFEKLGCLKDNRKVMSSQQIISTPCCIKAYASGVYLAIGTSSIKFSDQNRKTTGYHLEFASKNYEFLSSFASILAQYDIFAKLVQRKNMYVLYVKDAGEVSNVLALIGSFDSVLKLQNEMATREVRNKVNRQTNCMSANINKTVEASMKQVDAIEKIINKVGLENLPADLQTVALLRLANTEESLEELLKLSRLPLTKSGLNHRFKKLIKLAESLGD